MSEKHIVSFGLPNPSTVNPTRRRYCWSSLQVPSSIGTEAIREILHISLEGEDDICDVICRKVNEFRSRYNDEPVWIKVDCQFAIRINDLYVSLNKNPATIRSDRVKEIKDYMNEYMRVFVKSTFPLLKQESAEYVESHMSRTNAYGITSESQIIPYATLTGHGWDKVYFSSTIFAEVDYDYFNKLGLPKDKKEAVEMFKSRSVLSSDTLRVYLRNKYALQQFSDVLQKLKAGDNTYVVSTEYLSNVPTQKLIRDFMSKEYSNLQEILFDIAVPSRLSDRSSTPGNHVRNAYTYYNFKAEISGIKLGDDSIVEKLDKSIEYFRDFIDMLKRCKFAFQALTDYQKETGLKADRAVIAKYLEEACRQTDMESKLWNKAREFSCRITEADEFSVEEENDI
jgi:hypothetical protein